MTSVFRNPIQVRSNTGNQWQSSCGSGRTTASRNTSASPGPVSHLSTRLDTLVCPVETCAQPHSCKLHKSKPCRLLHTMQHRAIPVLFNSADTRSLDNYCTSWLNMLRTYLDFSFDHLWSASIPPVCWDFWVFRCLQCPEKVLVRFCSKPICSSARWRRSKATQSSGRPEAMASGSPAVPWGACSWTAKYCTANEPEMMCWWHHVTSLQFLTGALVRSKEDANMFGIVWTCFGLHFMILPLHLSHLRDSQSLDA